MSPLLSKDIYHSCKVTMFICDVSDDALLSEEEECSGLPTLCTTCILSQGLHFIHYICVDEYECVLLSLSRCLEVFSLMLFYDMFDRVKQ
jgi:hypothetical protein